MAGPFDRVDNGDHAENLSIADNSHLQPSRSEVVALLDRQDRPPTEAQICAQFSPEEALRVLQNTLDSGVAKTPDLYRMAWDIQASPMAASENTASTVTDGAQIAELPQARSPEQVLSDKYGVVIREQNGRLEYGIQADGRMQSLFRTEASEDGIREAEQKLTAIVSDKESALSKEFGIRFSLEGEQIDDHWALRDGKLVRDGFVHGRTPQIGELYAIENALRKSQTSPDGKTSFKGMKFCFLDKQYHDTAADGSLAGAGWHPGRDGKGAIYIEPGVLNRLPSTERDKGNTEESLESVLVHEIGHQTLYEQQMFPVVPPPVAEQIGWSPPEMRESGAFAVRDGDGKLYLHRPDNRDYRRWWTRIDPSGTPVDAAGNPVSDPATAAHKSIGELERDTPESQYLIQTQDGKLFSHDVFDSSEQAYWVRRDKSGTPLDSFGREVDSATKAEHLTNNEMRGRALIRPSSSYFDSPAEMLSEGLKNYRLNEEHRKELLDASPKLYELIKRIDQSEINRKCGLNQYGLPKYIRMPNGGVAPRTAANLQAVYGFEQ